MTAIFAYVDSDVAFVAGDSLRNFSGWGAVRARKVHHWSDRTVFAQCGDGKFLSLLIQEVKTAQAFLPIQFPNLSDDARLLQALAHFQPTHYASACKAVSKLASGSAHITGTILVASTADSFGPERISSFDFVTGTYSVISRDVAAEGTAASHFLTNAQAKLAAMKVTGSPFPIDLWAAECLENAIKAHPSKVGWPGDLILARPASHGRLTLAKEIAGPITAGVSEFKI